MLLKEAVLTVFWCGEFRCVLKECHNLKRNGYTTSVRDSAQRNRKKSQDLNLRLFMLQLLWCNVIVGEEKDGTSMPLLSLKNNKENVKNGNMAWNEWIKWNLCQCPDICNCTRAHSFYWTSQISTSWCCTISLDVLAVHAAHSIASNVAATNAPAFLLPIRNFGNAQ